MVLNFHCLRDLKCAEKAVSPNHRNGSGGRFHNFSKVFETQRKSHLSKGTPQSHHFTFIFKLRH